MMNAWVNRIGRNIAGFAICAMVFVTGTIGYVQFAPARYVVPTVDKLPSTEYVIVLGASIKQDGTPSDALYDRILTGVEIYKAGKASKVLMTGDNGAFHVNEVGTMEKIARESGVRADDLLVDGQGYRTYESCKRAAEVYKIKKAVIVTQRFHLSRALFLCRAFGIDAQGVPADRRTYVKIVSFTIRDLFASFKAWWDVYVWSPEPPVSFVDLTNET